MEININDLEHFNEQFKKIVKDIAYILYTFENKSFLDPDEGFKMVEDIKALLYGVSDNASCKYICDANYFQIIRYFIENKMAITFSFINKANAIKDTESLEFVKQKLELLTALEQNMRMFAMIYNLEGTTTYDMRHMFDNCDSLKDLDLSKFNYNTYKDKGDNK